AELKRPQPQIHSVHQWLEDSTAQLQGSLNERVEVITDYIKFCISSTILVKAIKKYLNSKPWITPHIIHSLREKQNAFQQQDWISLKSI
ncbi:RNA-directed DNA polymerase from mobile element jockey, partial [Scomber scombrus]